MKTSNIDVEQLRRGKRSSAESKFEWLSSALSFGKAKKVVVKKKSSK